MKKDYEAGNGINKDNNDINHGDEKHQEVEKRI